jgi:alginate O-acetyltransferase complex protein AlgJ
MFPVMQSASRLNGILFCVLLASLFLYTLPGTLRFAQQQDGALALFMDGELIRRFEQAYDRDFPLRQPSILAWANLQYLVFGEGASGVMVGRDGWLFSNEEYRIPNAHDAVVEQHLARIRAVHERLRAENRQLILVPVPLKADIYAEQAEWEPDVRATDLYERFIARLQALDIPVTPLRDAFLTEKSRQLLFLRSDTHWSPQGARLAAREFARLNPQLIGQSRYASRQMSEKQFRGDLQNFLLFSNALHPELFSTEAIPIYETAPLDQALDADQLFGEADQSIMLVGSSYTRIDDWNFPGFLREALQSDLLTTAVEAHGPFHAMEQFLNDEANRQGIDTVIWEFPVRTLLTRQAGAPNAPDTLL